VRAASTPKVLSAAVAVQGEADENQIPDLSAVARGVGATCTSIWRREANGAWRIIFDRGSPFCDCAAPQKADEQATKQ
jgi:hypothetical protein